MDPNNAETATILEIQRMSTEDGPGIRTTVFFKGCSLKCTWCHNPESIPMKPQVHWIDNRCIGCKSCLEQCGKKALDLTKQGISIDRSLCEGCGSCAEECPSTAMEQLGQSWTLNDLVHEVIKDKSYFDKSEGGITISGGEPALQAPFAAAFLKAVKENGIQTAFDTCGLVSKKSLEMILPYTTTVLYDLKIIDSERHKQLTGAGNKKILDNLKFAAKFITSHVHPKSLWIRTPVIPGATDDGVNIEGIGNFIAENLGNLVKRWELCAFNNLCTDKYNRLGSSWSFAETELVTESKMKELTDIAKGSGVNPEIVQWTGSARLRASETDSIIKTEPGSNQNCLTENTQVP